jgi:hypothetical protein
VTTEKRPDWRDLCKAAAHEQNPKEFMALISMLITTLEESKESTTLSSDSLATSV